MTQSLQNRGFLLAAVGAFTNLGAVLRTGGGSVGSPVAVDMDVALRQIFLFFCITTGAGAGLNALLATSRFLCCFPASEGVLSCGRTVVSDLLMTAGGTGVDDLTGSTAGGGCNCLCVGMGSAGSTP